MKRLFLVLVAIGLFTNTSFADTTSEQIKFLYAENNTKEAFNLLLSIPEEEHLKIGF